MSLAWHKKHLNVKCEELKEPKLSCKAAICGLLRQVMAIFLFCWICTQTKNFTFMRVFRTYHWAIMIFLVSLPLFGACTHTSKLTRKTLVQNFLNNNFFAWTRNCVANASKSGLRIKRDRHETARNPKRP